MGLPKPSEAEYAFMVDQLKYYQDLYKKPKCVKCGCLDASVVFHRQDQYLLSNGCNSPNFYHVASGEHLHYVCRNCHYDWVGPTQDQKGVSDAVHS